MIKLTFLGDIFPADELFTNGFGIKSKTNEKSVSLWTHNITDVIGKADYIIGNLESPLIDDIIAKEDTFYGRPLFADVLKNSGINILNIANNHILEHGIDGFKKTINSLHYRKLLTVGEEEDNKPHILTIDKEGTRICMAGFCDEHICNIDNPGCYASLNEENVFEALERMKAMQTDIIILIFHWGNEYVHIPSLEQRLLSYKLIDCGADLIVGHHPHVIQPYEKYKHGHIIYSLGNFCFDDVQSSHFGKGMISRVKICEKAISDICFSGINIQDMAYSQQLIKPMSVKTFEKYFAQINYRYSKFAQLSHNDYLEKYAMILRREHAIERIRMRLNILKKVIDIRHQHHAQLLRNIKKYIL